MDNMEEILLNQKEIIELVVDVLKENESNINSKVLDLIRRVNKTDKILAKKIKESFLISKYNKKRPFIRSVDANDITKPTSEENLDLIKIENGLSLNSKSFVWQNNVKYLIEDTLKEHKHRTKLLKQGLEPIKSILFYGAPGVGKTMAAKIVAKELGLPICILDLSTIMNSYLGKTGSNIRKVFDYAINNKCVLLIDELDAIAKQRTDESEVGELKRLVTVLLQAIDNWPSSSVLIGATNHPELLDRAIWRRFDQVIEFQLPDTQEVTKIINNELENKICDEIVMKIFVKSCVGLSHGLIKKEINKILKDMIINNKEIEQVLCENISTRIKSIDREDKLSLSRILFNKKLMTQRKLSEILCVSRDAIRKYNT